MSRGLVKSMLFDILVSPNTTKKLTVYWHRSRRVHMVRYKKLWRIVIFRNSVWQLVNLEGEADEEN